MSAIDTKTFNQCIVTYQRHCSRNGYVYNQPSRDDSYVSYLMGDVVVVLVNANGELARFRLTGTRVTMLEGRAR
jgi:hypothetical protein